jgi:hypothetical protein
MKKKFHITAFTVGFAALILTALTLPVLLGTSCTKTLDGEPKPNQKPIVYFVNIPPEGAQFSRNPVIYWVGTDNDGILSYFRYHVATEDEMGMSEPTHDDLMQYIASIDDDSWTYLDIDPTGPDPQTSNVIEMSASLESPVKTFVNQYVFLQGVDEDGLASDIVVRRFARNDNPPDTEIRSAQLLRPAINSVHGGGIITGVQLRFRGDDPIDYPDADTRPPFEYQWRLYGPYTKDTLEMIKEDYVAPVCVTTDAEVFHVGEEIERLEISYDSLGQVDTTRYTVTCDPNADVTDSNTDWPSMVHYVDFDTMLMVDSFPDWAVRFGDISYSGSDTAWNSSCGAANYRCEAKSNPDVWLGDTLSETWVVAPSEPYRDTIFNVYWDYASDTTLQMDFIFWVRSRDDAEVADLIPPFEDVSVINPRYERDVAVLDYLRTASPNNFGYDDSEFNIRAYWKNMIDNWSQTAGYDIEFDTTTVTDELMEGSSPDYIRAAQFQGGPPIATLLKHKLLIVYKDGLGSGISGMETTFQAIDAGINAWVTWRDPGHGWSDPTELMMIPPPEHFFYFAVERSAWRGWAKAAFNMLAIGDPPKGFYQDFVGGLPRYGGESGWPFLPIDTSQLHQRYVWEFQGGRFSTWAGISTAGDSVGVKFNPGLPEVNWSQVRSGGETLYKYKSSYGASHPLGFRHSFQGRPVALRYPTSLFRTAYFNFTPLAIDDDSMQVVADSILTWLYDPTIGTVEGEVRENRYPDAPIKISIEEARDNARQREDRLREVYEIHRQEGLMPR